MHYIPFRGGQTLNPIDSEGLDWAILADESQELCVKTMQAFEVANGIVINT